MNELEYHGHWLTTSDITQNVGTNNINLKEYYVRVIWYNTLCETK